MNKKKYYFPVANRAEDVSTGYMRLTREEAELVAKATNPENWERAEIEKYSGSFRIELDQAIPEEWWDYHKQHTSSEYAY